MTIYCFEKGNHPYPGAPRGLNLMCVGLDSKGGLLFLLLFKSIYFKIDQAVSPEDLLIFAV